MAEDNVFRSSVNREPRKPKGFFAQAIGALVAATTPKVAENPQVVAARNLPTQPKENIEALQLATEQTAELRGQVSLAVRQLEELRKKDGGKEGEEYKRYPDAVTKAKGGIPVLRSAMEATIRDPRRVSVDGRDTPRGLSSNPFIGEDSKVNHIAILRMTRTSTDPAGKPFNDDKIVLTVESTDERAETYGQGRGHSVTFTSDENGKEHIEVRKWGYRPDGKQLPPEPIYPPQEQLQSLVDMISAAAMDSDPHQPLYAEQPPHQAQ